MNENTPTYSSKGKIRLTYSPDRCMNKKSPLLRLINYIAGEGGGLPGLYDTLYTNRGRMKWGNGNHATDVGNQAPPLAPPLDKQE